MDLTKIKYLPPAPGDKVGKECIAKMFSHCKIESVKAFNKIGLNAHGGTICLKWKADKITEKPNF